jgi:hypothetical protein
MKSLKIPKGQSETVNRRRTATQRPNEKVQKDKQRSTKHTYKTKDRATRTPLNTGGEHRCSGNIVVNLLICVFVLFFYELHMPGCFRHSLLSSNKSYVARRVPHMVQELLTLIDHLSSLRVLVGFVQLDL